MKQKIKLLRAITSYRQYGLLALIKRIAEAIGFKFYKRSVIFYYKNLKNIPDDFCKDYSFIIPSAKEVQKETSYEDQWFSKEKTIERIRNGYTLFSYKDKDRMVYFHWSEMKKSEIRWLDYVFQFPTETTYMTGEFVLPEYRRKGLASRITIEIDHYLKHRGFKQTIFIKDPENITAVQKTIKLGSLGGIPYQLVEYRRIWFVKYYRVKKVNSQEQVSFISIGKSPQSLWKAFLPGY
ncbi:MAG: GNAT family N-acetyltransferase [Thermodesulfobacteriota bacterium]